MTNAINTQPSTRYQPQVAVVDFNHARGPEVEFWISSDGEALYNHNDWSLLPFMALSDGVHAMVEDFSYFTLLRRGDSPPAPLTETKASKGSGTAKVVIGPNDSSLFGIACTRQIRSDRLKRRSADVTRGSVQKAVVVVTDDVKALGELRTRLGAVTMAWFAQEDFSDITILKEFQESLIRTSAWQQDDGEQHYFGLSLREMIHEFRHNTLVLVKCLLLQRKMLFFSSKCERLCLLQFSLLSLIPALSLTLRDCAHPSLDSYSATASVQTSLRTSSRASLLAYMGLPIHIFGRGAFFGPYTPLQHLDVLADYDTKSYVVGSTNSLLLQQRERYADILINLDDTPNSISILSPSLRAALTLSAADRRWIDGITQTVLDTWDPENPGRPKNMGFAGSEEAIRMAFEEYLLGLVSAMAYQEYHEKVEAEKEKKVELERVGKIDDGKDKESGSTPAVARAATAATATVVRGTSPAPPVHKPVSSEGEPEIDPGANALDFSPAFLALWRNTYNYALFSQLTSSSAPPVWEISPPRHPTAGGLSVEDVQRRLQQKMVDLGIDERVREGKVVVGRALEAGREKVGVWREGVGRFWERRRDGAEGKRDNEAAMVETGEPGYPPQPSTPTSSSTSTTNNTSTPGTVMTPGSWTTLTTLRDRASKAHAQLSTSVQSQLSRPETTQLQASARENAAKAGAYLSSWGSWARERSGGRSSSHSSGGDGGGGGGGGGGGAVAQPRATGAGVAERAQNEAVVVGHESGTETNTKA